MIGATSLSPAHRRVWDSGVLVVLIWVAFHLLGCMHSHGPGFEDQHYPLNALSAAAAPVAAFDGGVAASFPERAPCCPQDGDDTGAPAPFPERPPSCPEMGDHTVARLRSAAPAPPLLGGALPAEARPDAPAA